MTLQKNLQKLKFFFLLAALFSFISCSQNKRNYLVVWTDTADLASFAEDFNASHNNSKVVIVYKEKAAAALPPAADELQPDIVIASWLMNSSIRKHFASLDFMFKSGLLNKDDFYPQILEYGTIDDKQYLIPFSFNLPMVIYSSANEYLLQDEHLLTLEHMEKISSEFNKKNDSGTYTAMGYAPGWDSTFLYEATKLNGAAYAERGRSFIWNEKAVNKTIDQMKNWTTTFNTDTTTEKNFQFRYLFMPKHRQISTGRSLFASIKSNEFFKLDESQSEGINFRWLAAEGKIPIEDDIVSIGLYKATRHTNEAEVFISWLLNEKTQKHLIERKLSMKLDTTTFGLANGFSSIKATNENYYPVYYRQLLGSLPGEKNLVVPDILPYRWNSIKEKIILPYLEECVTTDSKKQPDSLKTRIENWNKQFY
ncbi:extracellular solute-binding protein [Treponema sp.]|uniref:extracellular solute-binding protein n=1 Tax=Treponema sp. TaxID=166 RepID=UPI0025E8E068|nr:extracellular solute-binding protein [Treponema sp.]MCR5217840.1 extracellular solute-binding protein [Treponema sp.]